MTERFLRLIPVILVNEGGFVNDPADPGGATKYGVSLRFLKSLGDLGFDLDGDGDVDIEDIRKLTIDDAKKVYWERFYKPLGLDSLKSEKLALQVFDHSVNAGVKSAVMLLQQVCGSKKDGIMGPKTIAAANTFVDNISLRYMDARKEWYLDLVENKPRFAKFIAGWIKRVNHTYQSQCQL
jgi:lysozyme family protein